jgi:putative iron-dependent peroxidase
LVEAQSVALIPHGSAGEGGSILLLQKWVHSVSAWEALGVAGQERAIGRRKADSVELDPQPPASHVARTDQDGFGRIFRRNIPYGDLEEHGTVFVGFCAKQRPLAAMLESMLGMGGAESGAVRDELTRFTRPQTGAYYFIPAADRLATLGDGERIA